MQIKRTKAPATNVNQSTKRMSYLVESFEAPSTENDFLDDSIPARSTSVSLPTRLPCAQKGNDI